MRLSAIAMLTLLAFAPLIARADAPPTSAPVDTTVQSVATPNPDTMLALARKCFRDIEGGKIDRNSLTPGGNALLPTAVIASFAKQLAPIGDPSAFVAKYSSVSDGIANDIYRVTSADSRHYVLFSFSLDIARSKITEIHLGPTSRT
jgi:hypothetical protein